MATEAAEIVVWDEYVSGVARLPDYTPEDARLGAAQVFREVATYCARHGVLADLHRACWFIDYDISMMVDRIHVQAPLVGETRWWGRAPAGLESGTFDREMKAITDGS